MAVMIPEAVEGTSAVRGAATARAAKPRVRYQASGDTARPPSGGELVRRHNRAAMQRRQVVLGQVDSSRYERPGRAAPKQPAMATSTGPSTSSRNQRKRTPRNVSKRTRQGYGYLTGKEHGGVLLAEFLAGVLILVIGTLTTGPKKGYTSTMASLTVRLTALTAVFFVLFLLAGTKAGKAAMWFGFLIDLGITFTATSQNVFADLAGVVQGQPLKDASGNPVDTTQLIADMGDEPPSALPEQSIPVSQ